MDNGKCVVLMPVAGAIDEKTATALRVLERRGYIVRRVYGYSAIDQARSQLATDALRDGFEELLWIDADVRFHPDDVDKVRAHQLPLCCGLYPKKGQRAFAANFLAETRTVKIGQLGGPIEIQRAGFGFMHTRRIVYDEVRAKHSLPSCNGRFAEAMVPYFLPMVIEAQGQHDYLAEDFAFCERARSAGFSIMADTSIRLFHVGAFAYGWEDAGRDPERYGDYTYTVW